MSNNNIRRYQDSQIKPILGPFRCGAVLKIWDQNRCLVLYGEALKSLTNGDHLFSDSLRGIVLCGRWLVRELEKVGSVNSAY
jgi:hypothetical protein